MKGEAAFLAQSIELLEGTYLPRIEQALTILPGADLWWRPHAGVIAAGTILLHLEGNLRQWVLSGLGGHPDRRRRREEFTRAEGEAGELLERLRETVRGACGVLAGLPPDTLSAQHSIQGFEVSGMEAVYHVVEHFSWHTGQLVWIAKARAGEGHGLAFYDEEEINRG